MNKESVGVDVSTLLAQVTTEQQRQKTFVTINNSYLNAVNSAEFIKNTSITTQNNRER